MIEFYKLSNENSGAGISHFIPATNGQPMFLGGIQTPSKHCIQQIPGIERRPANKINEFNRIQPVHLQAID